MDRLISIQVPKAWLVELPPEQFNRLIVRLAQQKHLSAAQQILSTAYQFLSTAYQCDREDAKQHLERILQEERR